MYNLIERDEIERVSLIIVVSTDQSGVVIRDAFDVERRDFQSQLRNGRVVVKSCVGKKFVASIFIKGVWFFGLIREIIAVIQGCYFFDPDVSISVDYFNNRDEHLDSFYHDDLSKRSYRRLWEQYNNEAEFYCIE